MTHPFDDLPRELWDASRRAARKAVRTYTDQDDFERVQAAVNMGLAAETLLMASVATIDVILLAASASPSSQLALSRTVNTSGALKPAELRTIEWADARRIMVERDKSLGGLHELLMSVMGTRNAAAHAALTDADDLARSAVNLVQIAALLHRHLPFEEGEYWGPQVEPMVTELKDKRTTATSQSKIAKIINAQKDYGRIRERFRGEALKSYVETARERPLPSFLDAGDGDYQEIHEQLCPACGNQGNVYYLGYDDGDVTGGYDDLEDEEYVEVVVFYSAYAFECPVCFLKLDQDEVQLLPGVAEYIGTERYFRRDEPFAALMEQITREPDFDDWK